MCMAQLNQKRLQMCKQLQMCPIIALQIGGAYPEMCFNKKGITLASSFPS